MKLSSSQAFNRMLTRSAWGFALAQWVCVFAAAFSIYSAVFDPKVVTFLFLAHILWLARQLVFLQNMYLQEVLRNVQLMKLGAKEQYRRSRVANAMLSKQYFKNQSRNLIK